MVWEGRWEGIELFVVDNVGSGFYFEIDLVGLGAERGFDFGLLIIFIGFFYELLGFGIFVTVEIVLV